MASITLYDLPLSEVLDRQAMRSLRGAAGEGNWVLGAFPAYIAPIASSPIVEIIELPSVTATTSAEPAKSVAPVIARVPAVRASARPSATPRPAARLPPPADYDGFGGRK